MTWNLDWQDETRDSRQLHFEFSTEACSRCGKTEWGTQLIHEGEAVAHVIPGAPVTWRCVVCDELVCGDCVLCKPPSENAAASLHPMFTREFWDVTYCSIGCRAFNIMSYALGQPLYLDSDAQAELRRCPECLVWMHSSVGRCCSALCSEADAARNEIARWRKGL